MIKRLKLAANEYAPHPHPHSHRLPLIMSTSHRLRILFPFERGGNVLHQPEDAKTKRSSVAEAIERLVDGPDRPRGLELSVVSVEGFPTTDEEWQQVRSFSPVLQDNTAGMAVMMKIIITQIATIKARLRSGTKTKNDYSKDKNEEQSQSQS